jgi:protein SCO1/2
MSRTTRTAGLAAVAIAIIATIAVVTFVIGRRESYAFKGGEIRPPMAAGALDLTDQHGQPFSLERERGNVLVVFFGYTTCPDLCPTTLSDYTAVKEALGKEAERARFVLVTVDPERDTAERLKTYLDFFDPDFIGLRGTPEQIEAAKQAYGVISRKVEYPDSATGYLVDHTSLTYVIDTEGRLRLTYGHGTDPADIADDVRHLL